MFDKRSLILASLAPIAIGVGVASAAFGASDDVSGNEPLRCEIQASENGSMILLDGMVMTDTAISGTYRFQIASAGGSGNTNIRQGGAFSAGAGDEVRVGRVMVGNFGAIYDASLEVTLDSETFNCSQRVGGNI